MKISKRDLEAFLRKECRLEEQAIYIDAFKIKLSTNDGGIVLECPALIGLLKVYFLGKKYIFFKKDAIELRHPLFQVESVKVVEDDIEISFK